VSKKLRCIGDRKKIKRVLSLFGGTPGDFPKKFYGCACCDQNPFRFGGVITEKLFSSPKIENNVGFFEPITTVLSIA